MEEKRKVYPALAEFDARSRTPDTDMLCKIFRVAIEKVRREAMALQIIPHSQTCPVSKEILQSLITME